MRLAAVSALISSAVLGIASNAAADCADPFSCVCMGSDVVAAEVTAINDQHIELTLFALAESEPVFTIGDTVSVSADHALQLGQRWFVLNAADTPRVWLEVPNNDQVQCIDATFTLQQTLDLTNGDNCATEALAASGQTSEDLPGCDDTVGFFCSAGQAAPTPATPWYALGLALMAGGLVTRRRADAAVLERR